MKLRNALTSPRSALTLQTQLSLPMIPFVVDTFARWLILRHQLEWYQIPDLVTFLVTYAFFCLGVMFTVNPPMIPSDQEVITNVELVRQRLLATCIFSITLAGGLSFFRAFDEFAPQQHVYKDNGIILIIAILLFFIHSFWRVCGVYLSYVNKGA